MLPAEYYTSKEIFGEEKERIFGARWLFAGHVSQLSEPGSYFLFELGRESLIVTRDKKSQVRALHNVCRHRGTRMCTETQGSFKGGIQCPYHAWTYGLDGALTGAPNMDDVEGFDKGDFPLNAVSTEVWEGLVFVNFSSATEPFEEAFAPLFEKFSRWHIPELQSVHRTVYDVEANWKLLFQNYSECYHCPTVHPVLNKLTPYRNSINDLEEGPFLGGPMRMSIEGGSMTMSGRACAAPLGEITGEDLDLVYYYTLFPNLFLSLHPDYVLIHRGRAPGPRSYPHRLRVDLSSRGRRQGRLRRQRCDRVLGHDQPSGLAPLHPLTAGDLLTRLHPGALRRSREPTRRLRPRVPPQPGSRLTRSSQHLPPRPVPPHPTSSETKVNTPRPSFLTLLCVAQYSVSLGMTPKSKNPVGKPDPRAA